MKIKPPRVGEIVAAAAGALLLVSLFLPWYREEEGGEARGNAWEAFGVLDLWLLIVALAGIALLLLETTQRTPAVAVAWSAVTVPLALIGAIWVLVRTVDPPGRDLEPLFALLGLVACAGVAIGALVSMRSESSGAGTRPTAAAGPQEGGAEPLPVPDPAPERRREER